MSKPAISDGDASVVNFPVAADPVGHRYVVGTYCRRELVIWPAFDGTPDQVSIRDIASHLSHIFYFPESFNAPFSAAQYACELATVLRKAGPLAQLHGLLANADEYVLGHIPPAARSAEKGMTMPPLDLDRRDGLAEAMQRQIVRALAIPDLATLGSQIGNQMQAAREQLDATLERDIGAYIYHRPNCPPPPLPRVIAPLRWDHAMERYIRLYGELTALCGVPAKE